MQELQPREADVQGPIIWDQSGWLVVCPHTSQLGAGHASGALDQWEGRQPWDECPAVGLGCVQPIAAFLLDDRRQERTAP